jgi:hypothetical protein
MALTATDKKEIETIIRKEIKDFIGQNTMKQFETKLIDEIRKDMKRNGKIETDIKDIVLRMLTEFYGHLYQQRTLLVLCRPIKR